MIKISKNFFIRSTVFIIIICLSSCSLKSVFTQNTKLNIGIAKKDFALFQEIFKSSNFDSYQINSKILSEDEAYNSISNQDIDFYIGNIEALISEKDFLKKKIIAKDSLAWIVNSQNPISSLEVTELQEIIKGEIKNWKKINNINEPILFIGRYDENFTNQNLVNYPDLSRIESRVQAKNEEDLIANICKFKNSISYIDLSSEALQNASKSVKKIFISKNDTNSNPDSMFQREIHLYYQPELIDTKNKLNELKHFINLFNSEEVRLFIKSKNYKVPSAKDIALENLAEAPIKIGIGVPQSGKYAKFGKAVINAVQIAKEEFEKSGGILGRNIELVICDDEANIRDGVKAIACAKEFIAQGVEAVIGHLGSEASIATSNIYQNHNIVQISSTAIHSGFTKQTNNQGYLFRMAVIDSYQAEKLADLINFIPKNKEKRVLIVHNGSISGTNLSALVFNSLRKDISIDIQAIEPKTKSYYSLIGSDNFNIMVLLGPEHDPGQVLIDLAVNNRSDVSVITTYYDSDHIVKKAGLLSNNVYNITSIFNSKSEPNFIDFKNKITHTKSKFIPYVTINSYLAANVLFKALKEYYRGKYSSLSIALHEMTFDIWGNKIKFDEYGDRLDKQIKIGKIESGEFNELDLD